MPRTIFENIVIQHFEEETYFEFCKYTPIRFFEILLIEKGQGSLVINKQSVSYSDNQLFIFIPNDQYTFEVHTPTTVSAIKFLNSFFINFSLGSDQVQRKEWFKKIETILHSANRTADITFKSDTEKSSILSLFKVLCNEYNNKALKNELILKNTLHSILQILSRNVNYDSLQLTSSKVQEIINYIHYHIYDSKHLSTKVLATAFNLSENYIGEYFKKQTGISLKKYILNYKIKLAETRLKHTDLTVSEIASELGFTDSSHLDKTFLSHKGITAGAFRLGKK